MCVGKPGDQWLLHLHLRITEPRHLVGYRLWLQGHLADRRHFSGLWDPQGYHQGPRRLQVHRHGDLRHQRGARRDDHFQCDPQRLYQLLRLSLLRLSPLHFHDNNRIGLFAKGQKIKVVEIKIQLTGYYNSGNFCATYFCMFKFCCNLLFAVSRGCKYIHCSKS